MEAGLTEGCGKRCRELTEIMLLYAGEKAFFLFLRGLLAGRAALVVENLALRQQLAIPQREKLQPRLTWRDRHPLPEAPMQPAPPSVLDDGV